MTSQAQVSAPILSAQAAIQLHPHRPDTKSVVSILLPGSKSYTIRALILAAMAEKAEGQAVRLWNPLDSDDAQAAIGCLKTLGLVLKPGEANGQAYLDVFGNVREIESKAYDLHANLSAATLRFLLALATVLPGQQTLEGQAGLNRRPVKDLVDALRALGADIEYLDREGYPPVRVHSSELHTDRIEISGSISSQYVSALLMISPFIQSNAEAIAIQLPTAPVSSPYLAMTLACMCAFGIQSEHSNDFQRFTIPNHQHIQASEYTIEPDASSAAYFAAIATLSKQRILLKNLSWASVQADMQFLRLLEKMGTVITEKSEGLLVEGHGVKSLNINMCDCPDQAQAMAVLLAFALGVSRIDGLQSLRVKETDRIAAVASELSKMGVQVQEEADALVIYGGIPQPASIATYGDHRMAMAFAVAGCVLSGLQIEDPSVVNKTYPGFWEAIQDVGIMPMAIALEHSASSAQTPILSSPVSDAEHLPMQSDKIVLIGFMGAGKSTVAQLVAQRLKLDCVEMDESILKQSGRTQVSDIFDLDGEAHFRLLEHKVAQALQQKNQVVVSTGGGVIGNPEAMACLSHQATVIWLDVSWSTVISRVGHPEADRPLLRNLERAAALYQHRLPLYQNAAHVRISTEEKTPQQIAQEILSHVSPKTFCSV